MSNNTIGIYGGGGFAREVAWLVASGQSHSNVECVAYIDDADPRPATLNGLPVCSLNEFLHQHPGAGVSIGIGSPALRRKLAAKCQTSGLAFATLVHSSVLMSDFVTLGAGCIVCAGTILTVNIDLSEHVHINLDCTIGHDVRIGAYSTLSPGVHVSGNVHIGEDVYVGTGVNIINGTEDRPLVIGDGCVIGAGSCVTKNLDPHTLYVGVPAVAKKKLQ